MANINRSAKSGSDWTSNELLAYNIDVVVEDALTFFQMPNLPAPTVDPEILTADHYANVANDNTYFFLRGLDLAMAPIPAQESAVDDFTVVLFRELGYVRRGRMARTRMDIPLLICGEPRSARTDVCIVTDEDILLLVQEDKRHKEPSDPEPQLIAEAIAAFSANNHTRTRTLGLPALPNKTIPGIVMKGTSPIFYKVDVTTALVQAVATGTYPNTTTMVHAYLPDIPRPNRRWSEGMKSLDNRQIILSCFEAFKQLTN